MLKYVLPPLYAVAPKTVYKMIQQRMASSIPLNKHLGIEIDEVTDGSCQAHVKFRDEVSNHIGTAHATVIFGLAEAASGGAMSGAMAPLMANIRPVASEAHIKFIKIAKGDLSAVARVQLQSRDLREQLKSHGRIVFDVDVEVTSGVQKIASMVVTWHITLR